MPQPTPIPFNALHGQYLSIKAEIDAAVARTLDSGWYILGQEVAAFEQEFSDYLAGDALPSKIACVGVNSGTDALQLALWACDVGPGDEVITVAHTAVATAAAISLTGATPVFVDIDPATYTMSPQALAAAITPHTKAVIPVHIYGHPADLDAILAVARQAELRVIEDCAQAHGACYHGRKVGTLGDLSCFSFYPTKNLGALGDGGAVVSRNPVLIERVRGLREYGWTPHARYVSQEQGMNSRLDELQAAILRVKLRHLDAWNATRRTLAGCYAAWLPVELTKPVEQPGCEHVYHLYVVRTAQRERLRATLQAAGIGTAVHYPVPVHQQPAYQNNRARWHNLAVTERVAQEILSLPMHPLLNAADVQRIAETIQTAMDGLLEL